MARAILVAGLNYGDEGKGTVTDWICRQEKASLVVRYNGGAQAAHNVVTDDGRHHCFAQFGAGTLAGARTLLSRHMLVNPLTLVRETVHLTEMGVTPWGLLHVEREAVVTTPFHVQANLLREMARGDGRHGSCGMGIGETRAHAIDHPDEALRVGDLAGEASVLRKKLVAIRDRMASEVAGVGAFCSDLIEDYRAFARAVTLVDRDWLSGEMRSEGTVVFEGAQGALLDQDFGFQPYTTWTDCTFGNAMELLSGFAGEVTRLGIVRSYATRHGAGPFVTESANMASYAKGDHNVFTPWQRQLRVGAFDLVATRYALDVIGGVDGLVMTHMDAVERANGPTKVCYMYDDDLSMRRPFDYDHQIALGERMMRARGLYEDREPRGYAEGIAESLGVPLYATSHGPRSGDKRLVRGAGQASTSSASVA
jgi:adenylosuccinate synthase